MSEKNDSPATLVAILYAAHRTGDRDLERYTRRELEERHGIKITFCRESGREREGQPHE